MQASRAEISRLNTKVSGLERELASAKDDAVQSANLVEALKKQVEELRKEMKDVMREAAAKLEVNRKRIVIVLLIAVMLCVCYKWFVFSEGVSVAGVVGCTKVVECVGRTTNKTHV